jgi:hypothetical protein
MTMFATSPFRARRNIFAASAVAAVCSLAFLAGLGQALPSTDVTDPAYSNPTKHDVTNAKQAEQPPAKIFVESPKPELLAKGIVIIPFRTENLQIEPVFGPAAATISPRIGHLHVTLDDATWHWAHTSNDPVIVAPLPSGSHKILIELTDADHNVLAKEVVKFEVPRQ